MYREKPKRNQSIGELKILLLPAMMTADHDGLIGKVNAQVLRPLHPPQRWYPSYLFERPLAICSLGTPTTSQRERFIFHLPRWDVILQGHNKGDEILSYLKIGVDIHDFFLPFKGDFQGTYYDSAFPPSIKFSNSKSCAGFDWTLSIKLFWNA